MMPKPGDVVRYCDSGMSDVPAYREWRGRVVTVTGPITWVVAQTGVYWPGN